jgi:predicted amidohydrolase
MLVDAAGNLAKVYRKHFLFETDERWASPGASFESFAAPCLGNRVSSVFSTQEGPVADGIHSFFFFFIEYVTKKQRKWEWGYAW